MLKIAYCDDLEEDRNNMMKILTQIEEKWKEEFHINSFSSGESLCENIVKNYYDIILLDIQMGGIDGIETARRIRANTKDTLIIFISSYDDRIKELFSFRTIAFLDKPLKIELLEKAILDAYEIIKNENETYFSYNKDGSSLYMPLDDIIYFESKKNTVIIHTKKKQDEYYYDTLTSVWKQLEKSEKFIMPHRSFIFNLKYVNIKSDQVIIKETGDIFNIGSKYKLDTRKRYLSYMEKRWG